MDNNTAKDSKPESNHSTQYFSANPNEARRPLSELSKRKTRSIVLSFLVIPIAITLLASYFGLQSIRCYHNTPLCGTGFDITACILLIFLVALSFALLTKSRLEYKKELATYKNDTVVAQEIAIKQKRNPFIFALKWTITILLLLFSGYIFLIGLIRALFFHTV